MAKDKDYIRLIHTAKWLRLRRDKLNDTPLCERCEELGRVAAATEVHHVIPVEDGLTKQEKERLMFDYFNSKPYATIATLRYIRTWAGVAKFRQRTEPKST